VRTVRCQSCLRPFLEEQPRPFAETFYYRSVLRIPDAAPPTEVCNNCYRSVTSTYNPHPEQVPNFLLRNLAK
jgi:hypothetical protein